MNSFKKTNLKTLVMVAFVVSLLACEKEPDLSLTNAQSKHPELLKGTKKGTCDVGFAKKLEHTIVLINAKGKLKSIEVAPEKLDFFDNVVNVNYLITENMLDSPFFKPGIKAFQISTGKAVPIDVFVEGAFTFGVYPDHGVVDGEAMVVSNGEKIEYNLAIPEEFQHKSGYVQIYYSVNSENCVE